MSWAEIKKAINSDLSKPLNALITDYLGNSAYGLQALKNKSVIKSIQRGTVTLSTSVDDTSISISAVNPKKCMVIVDNMWYCDMSNATYMDYGVNVSKLSSNQLTITRAFYSSDSKYMKCSWQIIEFY